MIVFVVYEHNYQDSCNHGVFSTEETAKEYVTHTTSTQPKKYECNFEIQAFVVDKGGLAT